MLQSGMLESKLSKAEIMESDLNAFEYLLNYWYSGFPRFAEQTMLCESFGNWKTYEKYMEFELSVSSKLLERLKNEIPKLKPSTKQKVLQKVFGFD
jgi:hypothetical protein